MRCIRLTTVLSKAVSHRQLVYTSKYVNYDFNIMYMYMYKYHVHVHDISINEPNVLTCRNLRNM